MNRLDNPDLRKMVAQIVQIAVMGCTGGWENSLREADQILTLADAHAPHWRPIDTDPPPQDKPLWVCQMVIRGSYPLPDFMSLHGDLWLREPGKNPSSVIPTHWMMPIRLPE